MLSEHNRGIRTALQEHAPTAFQFYTSLLAMTSVSYFSRFNTSPILSWISYVDLAIPVGWRKRKVVG